MTLPFTPEQFFEAFAEYNTVTWPGHILLYLFAGMILLAAVRPTPMRSRFASALLAFLWIWTGVLYHWLVFSEINPAAWIFGGAFVLEGLLLVVLGTVKPWLDWAAPRGASLWIGLVFVVYALVIYPLLNPLTGHVYPAAPVFALPCPLTIFSFGALLLARGRARIWVAIIPLLWSLVGTMAAIKLGVVQDYGLLVAGVVGFITILATRKLPPPEYLEEKWGRAVEE